MGGVLDLRKYPAEKKVRLPVPLWGALKDQAEREGVPIWVIVHRAFTAYISRYRSHYTRDIDAVDRAAWYAFKLAATIGRIYDHSRGPLPSDLSESIEKVLAQLRDRIGVETGPLEAAIAQYLSRPTKKNRMLLSGAAKRAIAEIIDKTLSRGRVDSSEGA